MKEDIKNMILAFLIVALIFTACYAYDKHREVDRLKFEVSLAWQDSAYWFMRYQQQLSDYIFALKLYPTEYDWEGETENHTELGEWQE